MTLATVTCELTRRCNELCRHCYAESGPGLPHGSMTAQDWSEVIDDAHRIGARQVRLIGGEPTLHPAFPALVEQAQTAGLAAEVYTNLAYLPDRVWGALRAPGTSVDTSYYSDDPAEHDRITGRAGSHARTRANIRRVAEARIPIRVGIVEVLPGQRIAEAKADLVALGVQRVHVDRQRKLGRAAATAPGPAELCGHCGRDTVAVGPDGQVWPCTLGRFLSAGNVLQQPLPAILRSAGWRNVLDQVPPRASAPCPPHDSDGCDPAHQDACDPQYEGL